MNRKTLLISLVSVACLLSAGANSTNMKFADLSRFDFENVKKIEAQSPPRVVAVERPISGSRALTRPVSELNVDPSILLELVRPNDTPTVIGSKRFTLPIAGKPLEFGIVDVVWDELFRTFHIAAVSMAGTGDYIRLSVSQDGRVLIGTAHVGETIYRIASDERNTARVHTLGREQQMVSQLGGSGNNDRLRDERRHVQLAEIAELQPTGEFITTAEGKLTHLLAENIGTIDLSGLPPLSEVDPNELIPRISKFLTEKQTLTAVYDPVELRIQSFRPGNTKSARRAAVWLEQYIDGIRIEGSTTNLLFEPDTGRVAAIGGYFYSRDEVNTDSAGWYTEDEATQLALRELHALGKISGRSELEGAELLYRSSMDRPGIEPYWRFVHDSYYIAYVNAVTGDVSIHNAMLNFRHQVCPASETVDIQIAEVWMP